VGRDNGESRKSVLVEDLTTSAASDDEVLRTVSGYKGRRYGKGKNRTAGHGESLTMCITDG
jgi:hypothetical protein